MSKDIEKIMYVGVSPKPYRGCNYWYIDDSGLSKAGSYVWVKMGRHDREQMVYVDSVRWCEPDKAPYPLNKAKKVLRQTTKEEAEQIVKEWNEFQDILM